MILAPQRARVQAPSNRQKKSLVNFVAGRAPSAVVRGVGHEDDIIFGREGLTVWSIKESNEGFVVLDQSERSVKDLRFFCG
jgi:hypothetical protein